MKHITSHTEFEAIVRLIGEARSRAFSKVNAELVLLYYHVGRIVSEKVAAGSWGDGTVNELAGYIGHHIPGLKGFNRRGIYRMKQFFETYAPGSACDTLWQVSKTDHVSLLATLLSETTNLGKVSPLATQIQHHDNPPTDFISTLLVNISWANHLEIFSAVKSPDQQLFYLLMCIKEKWSKLELRRQIQTAAYERSILSQQKAATISATLPQHLFKDPYIFEFLDLPDVHSEKDLETALVVNLQKFLVTNSSLFPNAAAGI